MPSAIAAPARRATLAPEPAVPTTGASAKAVRRAAVQRGPGFSSVEIHLDVASAEPAWRDLLPNALAGPFQNPVFLGAWANHAGRAEGAETLVAVARDEAGAPVALLPLCVARRFGVAVARFLGGSHVNYNMAPIRRDQIEAFADGEAARLFATVAREARIDLYALVNQPLAWRGAQNPLASLPRQPSADPAFCGPVGATIEEHLALYVSSKSRSSQRRKTRRFEERGAPRIYRAETAADRRRLLDIFLAQKAQQFAARGMGDPFEAPGVAAFLAEAGGLEGGPAVVDFYGFELDGEVLAVHAGIADDHRHSGMFNSITSGELAKYSPGEILMSFVVEEQVRRGRSIFDLGVGAAAYKRIHCPNEEPLFDSIFGATAKGRAAAAALSAMAAAKARIKADPRAAALVARVRKMRAKTEAPAAATEG